MRITAFLGHVPESTVVSQPAKFIEGPIYPCRVAQSMLWDERIPGEIHGRNPAILVVHGQELDGKRLAVPAPDDSSGTSVGIVRHYRYGALPELRVLAAGSICLNLARGAVLFANRLQGVVADARKTVYAKRMRGVIDEIQQYQGLPSRRGAPYPQPFGLEFLITPFGDIARELAFQALGRGFSDGYDDQPPVNRRQFGYTDAHALP